MRGLLTTVLLSCLALALAGPAPAEKEKRSLGLGYSGSNYGNDYNGNDYNGNDYNGNDYNGNDYNGNNYLGSGYSGNDYNGNDYVGSSYTGYSGYGGLHGFGEGYRGYRGYNRFGNSYTGSFGSYNHEYFPETFLGGYNGGYGYGNFPGDNCDCYPQNLPYCGEYSFELPPCRGGNLCQCTPYFSPPGCIPTYCEPGLYDFYDTLSDYVCLCIGFPEFDLPNCISFGYFPGLGFGF